MIEKQIESFFFTIVAAYGWAVFYRLMDFIFHLSRTLMFFHYPNYNDRDCLLMRIYSNQYLRQIINVRNPEK